MRFVGISILLAGSAVAATTGLNVSYFGSVGGGGIRNNGGTLLAVGTAFQIGYFAGVPTAKDPSAFDSDDWAAFTPLTGNGSPNPSHDTRIGNGTVDNNEPGLFSESITFIAPPDIGLPGASARFGIRFYDAPTETGSGFFNVVTGSGSTWILPAATSPPDPAPTPPNVILDLSTLTWQSGDSGFATTIPLAVPAVTPVITGVAATGAPNEFLLTYDATPGVEIAIETSTVPGGWGTPTSGNTTATPAMDTGNTVTVTTAPSDGARFWRLRVP